MTVLENPEVRLGLAGALAAGAMALGLSASMPGHAATSAAQNQNLQVEVAEYISWGDVADDPGLPGDQGCDQQIATHDFNEVQGGSAFTPSPTAPQLKVFGAAGIDGTPANAPVVEAGSKVWRGCVATNAPAGFGITASGTQNLTAGPSTLGLDRVSIGITDATNKTTGTPGGDITACDITPDLATAIPSCNLPTGGSVPVLTSGAPGVTQLDWQYQLNLPANQPAGNYTGGQVTFTATTL